MQALVMTMSELCLGPPFLYGSTSGAGRIVNERVVVAKAEP